MIKVTIMTGHDHDSTCSLGIAIERAKRLELHILPQNQSSRSLTLAPPKTS
jgi:hypothetical protein